MRRLHLIGFPHTALADDRFTTCAYTAKVEKFLRMGWGDRLLVYHAESDSPGVVDCFTAASRELTFGDPDPELPPVWPTDEQWRPFNAQVIRALHENAAAGDFLLLAGGLSQRSVADRFPELLAVEPGVGYEGVFADHCAFESAAWRHFVYGKYGWDGRAYDTVIPNYFDPDDFHEAEPEGYALFMGRVTQRKGPHVAAEIAERLGMRLVVAGPGVSHASASWLRGDHVEFAGEYVGVAAGEYRARLLAQASVVIVPTLYVEPFGGVAVEAMLSGTPVVASDWGAFTETVEEGVTGYRFSVIQQGVDAVCRALELDRARIRQRAIERFSLEAVRPQYEAWFELLETRWGGGYYAHGPAAAVAGRMVA